MKVGNIACSLCPFKTGNGLKYNSHMRAHTQPPIIECPFCPYKIKYELKNRFRDHLFKHLGEDLECTQCSYRTTCLNKLRQHYYAHTVMYNCAQCSFKTKFKDTLKEHVRKHQATSANNIITNTKEKLCPVCGVAQHNIDDYHRHIEEHSTDLSCRFCTKFKTHNIRNLRRHILKMHSIII